LRGQQLADPVELPPSLPELNQGANDVANHLWQESVRDDPNLEELRGAVAARAKPGLDLMTLTAKYRPNRTPQFRRSR
jgi:hypothetical protein